MSVRNSGGFSLVHCCAPPWSVSADFGDELSTKLTSLSINIEKLDRSEASGRGQVHPDPAREEKDEPAGLDRDQVVAIWVLDLASRLLFAIRI